MMFLTLKAPLAIFVTSVYTAFDQRFNCAESKSQIVVESLLSGMLYREWNLIHFSNIGIVSLKRLLSSYHLHETHGCSTCFSRLVFKMILSIFMLICGFSHHICLWDEDKNLLSCVITHCMSAVRLFYF